MVRAWRETVLPSASSEEYWRSVTELGSKLGEETGAKAIAERSPDLDTALAAVAVQAWKHPELVEELSGWYGLVETQIQKKLWDDLMERMRREGASERDILNARIASRSPDSRAGPGIKRLLAIHLAPSYTPIWEAWLLCPASEPRNHREPRVRMDPRIDEALRKIPSPRTPKLALEKFRLLGVQLKAEPERIKHLAQKPTHMLGLILSGDPDPRESTRRLLECYRVAVDGGFAEIGGIDSVRKVLRRVFSGRVDSLDQLEDPVYLRQAKEMGQGTDPKDYPPMDDRWKGYKPVIEDLLREPKGLTQSEVDLLKDSLSVMPQK